MSGEPLTEGIDAVEYGRFAGPPSRPDLERYCFLDDVDRQLIAKRRGDANRLGFSLQLVTLRYIGTFLADPLDVPTEVVDYLAEQLGISDPSCLKAYMGREKTRFEHQWEIAREYGCGTSPTPRMSSLGGSTTGPGSPATAPGRSLTPRLAGCGSVRWCCRQPARSHGWWAGLARRPRSDSGDALATIPTPAHESGTNRGRHEFADPC
ncbi:MAG: hypothetical protein QOH66_2270 [Actinomycetota bacterium]|nr:hypothetical protein [Actinomycetota bacterium]